MSRVSCQSSSVSALWLESRQGIAARGGRNARSRCRTHGEVKRHVPRPRRIIPGSLTEQSMPVVEVRRSSGWTGDVLARLRKGGKPLSNSTAERDPKVRRTVFLACPTRSLAQPRHGKLPVRSGGSHVPGEESTGLERCLAVAGPGDRDRSPGLPSSPARDSRDDKREAADEGRRTGSSFPLPKLSLVSPVRGMIQCQCTTATSASWLAVGCQRSRWSWCGQTSPTP